MQNCAAKAKEDENIPPDSREISSRRAVEQLEGTVS